jgi:hypothetical protein
MKAVSPNVMPKGGEPRVPGPADVAGVKSNASVFAQRHKETRPAWLEACELARRAGDDLERLADRLAGVTGTCGGRCSRRSSVANREDARSRRVPFRDGLVAIAESNCCFSRTRLTPLPCHPRVTDASSETEGTLVSALRLYSAAKASAEAGRHDVAVETFAEVRIPRSSLDSRHVRQSTKTRVIGSPMPWTQTD